jgi:hypothetical protein
MRALPRDADRQDRRQRQPSHHPTPCKRGAPAFRPAPHAQIHHPEKFNGRPTQFDPTPTLFRSNFLNSLGSYRFAGKGDMFNKDAAGFKLFQYYFVPSHKHLA